MCASFSGCTACLSAVATVSGTAIVSVEKRHCHSDVDALRVIRGMPHALPLLVGHVCTSISFLAGRRLSKHAGDLHSRLGRRASLSTAACCSGPSVKCISAELSAQNLLCGKHKCHSWQALGVFMSAHHSTVTQAAAAPWTWRGGGVYSSLWGWPLCFVLLCIYYYAPIRHATSSNLCK